VSLVIGIGPECCDKLHIPWTADNEAQIEAMKEAIRNVTFEGWLPKLKIQRMEVLEAGA
jgi:hypothetical protein